MQGGRGQGRVAGKDEDEVEGEDEVEREDKDEVEDQVHLSFWVIYPLLLATWLHSPLSLSLLR
jgi:hypothetical protein